MAKAGSTILFFESLIHSSGINRSGKDRYLIWGGFTPDIFQPWLGYEPHPDFIKNLSVQEKPFYNRIQKIPMGKNESGFHKK